MPLLRRVPLCSGGSDGKVAMQKLSFGMIFKFHMVSYPSKLQVLGRTIFTSWVAHVAILVENSPLTDRLEQKRIHYGNREYGSGYYHL